MDSGQSEPVEVPVEGRPSFDSRPTAVNGGPSSGTRTSAGEDDFERMSSHSLSSFLSTLQLTPGVGIVHQSLGTFLSTIPPVIPGPHFQYMSSSQRRVYSSTRRTSSGFSSTRPNVIRASTSALYTACRDAPTVLDSPRAAVTSSYMSSDLNDETLLCTSLTFEEPPNCPLTVYQIAPAEGIQAMTRSNVFMFSA